MQDTIKSGEVLGKKVIDRYGNDIGKIEEIVLDKLEGIVKYAVLSFGSALGIGKRLYAVPWNIISYDVMEDKFIIAVNNLKLENAPGFDQDNWPNMADYSFIKQIQEYY